MPMNNWRGGLGLGAVWCHHPSLPSLRHISNVRLPFTPVGCRVFPRFGLFLPGVFALIFFLWP